MKTLLLLLISSICVAQIPSDFKDTYDTATVIFDDVVNNKQLIYKSASFPNDFDIYSSRFRITVSYDDNKPISKYLQFMCVPADTVEGVPESYLKMEWMCFRAIVPKSAMTGTLYQKIPIMRVYENGKHTTQSQFFSKGDYYYVYCKHTRADGKQKFMIDWTGGGDITKMEEVIPNKGQTKVFTPLTQTITLYLEDPQ